MIKQILISLAVLVLSQPLYAEMLKFTCKGTISSSSLVREFTDTFTIKKDRTEGKMISRMKLIINGNRLDAETYSEVYVTAEWLPSSLIFYEGNRMYTINRKTLSYGINYNGKDKLPTNNKCTFKIIEIVN